MKKLRFSASALAYGGIGCAVSLSAVTGAFYLQSFALIFYVIAGFGLLIPLSKSYYREAILAFVATTAIGAIYTTIYILPYVLITGAYTIVAIICHEKKVKSYIIVPIAIAWSCFAFFALYELTSVLALDVQKFSELSFLPSMNATSIYVLCNAIFTVCVVVYHYGIIWAHQYLKKLVAKIKIGR